MWGGGGGGGVLQYHCILHQEQLGAKSIGFKSVMSDVVSIVNNIRSEVLSHRQFKLFWMRWMHQEVRWLSREKALFFELQDKIRTFQARQEGSIQVPTDRKWISDLAFFGGCDRAAQRFESPAPREGPDNQSAV